jgi:hypothetical protein
VHSLISLTCRLTWKRNKKVCRPFHLQGTQPSTSAECEKEIFSAATIRYTSGRRRRVALCSSGRPKFPTIAHRSKQREVQPSGAGMRWRLPSTYISRVHSQSDGSFLSVFRKCFKREKSWGKNHVVTAGNFFAVLSVDSNTELLSFSTKFA